MLGWGLELSIYFHLLLEFSEKIIIWKQSLSSKHFSWISHITSSSDTYKWVVRSIKKLTVLHKTLNTFQGRNKTYFSSFDVRFFGVCDLGLMSDAAAWIRLYSRAMRFLRSLSFNRVLYLSTWTNFTAVQRINIKRSQNLRMMNICLPVQQQMVLHPDQYFRRKCLLTYV